MPFPDLNLMPDSQFLLPVKPEPTGSSSSSHQFIDFLDDYNLICHRVLSLLPNQTIIALPDEKQEIKNPVQPVPPPPGFPAYNNQPNDAVSGTIVTIPEEQHQIHNPVQPVHPPPGFNGAVVPRHQPPPGFTDNNNNQANNADSGTIVTVPEKEQQIHNPVQPVHPPPGFNGAVLPRHQPPSGFTDNNNNPYNGALMPRHQPSAGFNEAVVLRQQPAPGFNGAVVPRQPAAPKFNRPHELARVSYLGQEDEKQHRQNTKRVRTIYDSLRIHLITEDKKRPDHKRKLRGDTRAAYKMRDLGLWLNQDKHIVGSIPGVEIGDMFFYRMELCILGLHGQPQAGIDCLTSHRSSNGEPIATSIIVSGGYEDDEDAGDVLVYSGQGGQDKLHRQCDHQRLVGGNLAMERSLHYGIEVRVIRGFKYENMISSKVYVYDGLYKIVKWWYDVGKSGFRVCKFQLVRIENQPEMGSTVMKYAKMLRDKPFVVRPVGYVTYDISCSKENVPVYLFNDIDKDQEPLYYEYLAKSVFPPVVTMQGEINRSGCECSGSCSDDCLCARKNGGEIAYDDNGILLRGKPVVFECGVYCKCGPGCKNRVTQKGLRHRLEVFRSKETGWGVKTLDLIQAGAFICEYAGVILTREQAEILSMNGDTMVYPSRFPEKWSKWGDLSQVDPNYVRPDYPSLPPLDFAMDVSKMRNMACYISDSKESNVMVQYVLYDHNNLMFPRVMLFALENISPLSELSLDYGLSNEVDRKLAICN